MNLSAIRNSVLKPPKRNTRYVPGFGPGDPKNKSTPTDRLQQNIDTGGVQNRPVTPTTSLRGAGTGTPSNLRHRRYFRVGEA